jgi:tetratricopeptide (TPR) repeat protein
VRKAQELEASGLLRQALDEWKIALTIKPDDADARAGRQALEGRIERGVADRVRQGREALARGEPLEARRHFLAALALDPNSRAAFDALQNEIKEVRFVSHTVRRGETLATIAERYYGDRSRAEVIWETNQLPPNPRLTVGSTLKIPEIPGVPFVHERPPTPTVAAAPGPAGAPSPAPDPARPGTLEPTRPEGGEERPGLNPLLVEAKEALDKGDYAQALADVDRLLVSNAQNEEGLDLKKAILYNLGRNQLTQKRYGESYRTLGQLASLQPNYRDVSTLLRQARDPLIEQHYLQGVRLFQAERLEDAVREWRQVLELDPQHANAKKNIEQAERLLRALQQRQPPKRP